MRNPSMQDLSAYLVTLKDWECLSQTLYDFQAYATTGHSVLTFFAVPLGQGATPKTLSDTNLNLAGQLPANQQQLVKGVEIRVMPTTPTVTAQMPAVFGSEAVAAIINDAYIIERSGNITFTIGSKVYLQEAPTGRLPAKTHFHLDAAVGSGSTVTTAQSRIAFGYSSGAPYNLEAWLLLTSNMNFGVTLNWPEGVQTITSAARIGVILNGLNYRKAQ